VPTDRAVCGVLFDLDGTLVDSAPDLARAVNLVRADLNLPPLPYEVIRPVVSEGSPGMLRVALGISETDPEYTTRRSQLLGHYAAAICLESRLFPGVSLLLETLERAQLPWGVVTNKPEQLAATVLLELGLLERCSCLIGGDTLKQKKPHPEPVRQGCQQAGIAVEQCVYVGDAERDIAAGRAAGCRTVAALYGYLPADSNPTQWQADALINSADELLQLDWFTSL